MGLRSKTAEDASAPIKGTRWLRRAAVLLGFIGAGAGARAAHRSTGGSLLAAPTALLARMRR